MNEWIEWNGGECPVSPETKVEVRFRNGIVCAQCPAVKWYWDCEGGYDLDIVAYRVVAEDKKTDDTAGYGQTLRAAMAASIATQGGAA